MELSCVIEEFASELDIFAIYQCFSAVPHTILLESRMDFEDRGRFSFLGLNPFLVLSGDAGSYQVGEETFQGNVFDKLRELLAVYRCKSHPILPMISGCIGYVSYDAGLPLEGVRPTARPHWDLPQLYYVFFDNLIIFDHKQGKHYITANQILKPGAASIADIKKALSSSIALGAAVAPQILPQGEIERRCTSNFSQEKYQDVVEEARQHIRRGDIYVMNMTRQLTGVTKKSAEEIYGTLRSLSPAPFSALLKLRGFEVISSSPERFLRVKDGMVETRPIKGTMPRGASLAEDAALKLKLQESAKDRAELLMIVDLERNDLNKVCEPQSVKVSEHCALETFSTVFHLVSTVQGRLRPPNAALDCLLACFPGGSITGAPKQSAMIIIDKLEGIRRGIYTGCIGYFAFNGNADFNIVIRTIIKKGEQISIGVGGGITWESDPLAEYLETMDKAKAPISAI